MKIAGRARGQTGFTMVELMVALSVMTILITIGVTSFLTVLRRDQVGTQARDFFAAANLARSEAVRRGSRVTLCRSTNGTSHTTTANWDGGWIVFADANGNAVVDAGEDILLVHRALSPGTTMVGPPNVITYNNQGLPSANGTITVSNAAKTMSIVLSATGRLTLQ